MIRITALGLTDALFIDTFIIELRDGAHPSLKFFQKNFFLTARKKNPQLCVFMKGHKAPIPV